MLSRIFAWAARALYVGPALNLSAHRNAVAVLALGLDGPFDVADPPADAPLRYRRTKSALIPPGTLHHFARTPALMAFIYVDPFSTDLDRLRGSAAICEPHACFSLADEQAYVGILNALASGITDWPAARAAIDARLSGAGPVPMDPRVKAVRSILHQDAGGRITLASLATHAGLSESRLRHLFKQVTGVPLRRYRIWVAMRLALQRIATGETLTTAAMDAGFSSSAHFSTAFRDMFGMEPSRLARGRLQIAG